MIYIVTHKKIDYYPSKKYGYNIILVGAANNGMLRGYLSDDTGDNISSENKYFCELTAMYWIWKNTADEVKGLVHYRRFFVLRPWNLLNRLCCLKNGIITLDKAKKILSQYDVIAPIKIHSIRRTAEERYNCRHNSSDLQVVKAVINEKYPEYAEAMNNIFSSHSFYYGNMLICGYKTFDDYCRWLFDILFEVQKRINYKSYDDYQARVFGFLSERLLGVYIEQHKLNVYELPVVNIERLGIKYIMQDISETVSQSGSFLRWIARKSRLNS